MTQDGGCKKLKHSPWSIRGVRCNKKVTGDHGYCAIHSPEAVARRAAKSEANWAAKEAAWKHQREANAERERKLEVFPELLAAAKELAKYGRAYAVYHREKFYPPDAVVDGIDQLNARCLLVEAAIAKAEGQP